MSDYFDHVERDLRAAVRRSDHLPWYVRLRRTRSRPLVVVLAALVIAGPALAAVSLLQSGSSVGPGVPPTPHAGDGVAITSSIQLLRLRASDPAGGPPWGMRTERTTRGVVCVQVGRIAFGTVGALGRDGAFSDDGRFHPFSPNYDPGPVPCPTPDSRSNAFINVADYGLPNSALLDDGSGNGCRTATVSPRRGMPASARQRIDAVDREPVCQPADLRDVYYGLLGPDAVSITYQTASGRLLTVPTSGSDGAYLIVLPHTRATRPTGRSITLGQEGTITYDMSLVQGAVAAVHYRNGLSCQVPSPGPFGEGAASCQPVGYVSRAAHLPNEAQVASPVSTRIERSNTKAWCVHLDPPGIPAPCTGRTPPGDQRLTGGPPSVLVLISWISRVPVRNGRSDFYYSFSPPRDSRNPNIQSKECGTTGQEFGRTDSDYKAGQRVTQSFFEPLACHGVAHGTVGLVISTGPSVPAGAQPAVAGQSVGREVGKFRLKLP